MYINLMSMSFSHQLFQHDGIMIRIANKCFPIKAKGSGGCFFILGGQDFKRQPNHHFGRLPVIFKDFCSFPSA